jgi:hypothetical protein
MGWVGDGMFYGYTHTTDVVTRVNTCRQSGQDIWLVPYMCTPGVLLLIRIPPCTLMYEVRAKAPKDFNILFFCVHLSDLEYDNVYVYFY